MELERERFEAWIFSQPPERVIESGDSERCFLCSFLKETTNEIPRMTFVTWGLVGRTLVMPLPDWAKALVDYNWCKAISPYGVLQPITVAQMQQRYIELFGPVGAPKPEPMAEPVTA